MSRCVVFIWCHTLWKVCCSLLLQTVSSFLGNFIAKVCECWLLLIVIANCEFIFG
jgi:hypothetical protein